MFLILECISFPHIYIALAQIRKRGGGAKEEVCPGFPNCEPTKTFVNLCVCNYTVLPILYLAVEANYYGCSQPLVTYVYCILAISYCTYIYIYYHVYSACAHSRSIEVARDMY